MKNKILLCLFLIPFLGFTQTKKERETIASYSNKVANVSLAKKLADENTARVARLNNYLQSHPEIKAVTYDNEGGKLELMDVASNGELIYAKTDNAGAATTARADKLYSGGSLGLNIQGQNMIGALWDGDNVRTSHREFMVGGVSKVTNEDGNTLGQHATHVTGTMAAQGIQANLRGIAFNSSIKSYNWTSDTTEMLFEAQNGLLTSNHSYGFGQLGSVWFYGAYDSRAKEIDEICFNNPYYQPVFSGGNSRNNSPIANPSKGGYDLVQGHANAKNVISVAAVNEVPVYSDSQSVVMSSFSSFGPSDDGRIKPEISMKGVAVNSTLSLTDQAAGLMSGTSMASPGVTGGVLLLQQYYNQLYSSFMRAQSVKGVILHTASEAGYTDGPDYEFGWGLINLENAAKVIRDRNLNINPSVMDEKTLATGTTFSQQITASGTQPLKVSISWTDPASPTNNAGTVDPNTKYLVNDLDVKVTSSNGTVYYPWKLQGMADPSGEATRISTNNVDNFERVDIENPSGTYTITVSHKGVLVNGLQKFTLIATADNLAKLSTSDLNVSSDDIILYPNPAQDIIYLKNNNNVEAKISILDNFGRIIKTTTIKNGAVDIRSLAVGNYLLVYSDKKGKQVTFKFIKN